MTDAVIRQWLSLILDWLQYNAKLTQEVLDRLDRQATAPGAADQINQAAQQLARNRAALSAAMTLIGTAPARPAAPQTGVDLAMASGTIQQAIDNLKAQVAQETTVNQSAAALINGIPAMIQAAVADAQAKGATADQLAAFDDLAATVQQNAQGLSQALTANTPAAPTGPGGTTPPAPAPPGGTTPTTAQGQQAAAFGQTNVPPSPPRKP